MSKNKSDKDEEKEVSIISLKWHEHLQIIEENFGVQGRYVVIGLSISIFFVLIGFLDKIITNLVGTLYPAYWSIKVIENNESDMDIQWLTYWVVFAIFTFIDVFSGFILRFFPFYFFAKILFLLWLFLPNFQGATTLYNYFVVKIFKRFEKDIELVSSNIKKHIDDLAKQGDLRKSDLNDKLDSHRSDSMLTKKLN
jgi:receptor expression-enhancing protein 5/6